MPDGQSVQGFGDGGAVLHARLWSRVRTKRAQDHVDGAGGPELARPRAWRRSRCARARRRVRDVAFRQCAGDRLRRASQAAALCGLSVRTRPAAQIAPGVFRSRGCFAASAGGRGMNAPAYNFAYLDEQTKRMIRRAILKAIAIPVYQVPIPEPLRFLEPRETETRRMHALGEYGLMHVKLYEDIARFGHIATSYAYPVKVNARYVMDPSPTPKFDNPKMDNCPALQLFGAGREKRI